MSTISDQIAANTAAEKTKVEAAPAKKEEVKELGKQKKKIVDKIKNTTGDNTKLNIKLVEIERKAAKIKEEAKSKPKEEK